MRQWVQKTLIVAVALLTFGVISPTHEIWTTLHDKDEAKQSDRSSNVPEYQFGLSEFEQVTEASIIDSAKNMAYQKFGSKIGPIISSEFDEVIFPKIEEAIQMTFSTSMDIHKRHLAISERPAGDYAEKIFHVKDLDTRKDLIRFHVRTEKRPQDGYFFNFHYHIADDGFVAHHSIGDIYWSKNTPPKWLS